MTRLCSLEGIINYNVVRPMLYSLGISVKGYCASTVCIVNKRYDICSRDVSQYCLELSRSPAEVVTSANFFTRVKARMAGRLLVVV